MTFTGFSDGTWEFLVELSTHNDTNWFNAEKRRYQAEVARPCLELVEAIGPALTEVHPALQAEAKVGRSLFRINRDTRFSADKTPYKTHLDFLFWVECGRPPRESPALIMRLTAENTLLGAGQMGLRDVSLRRYRDAVVATPGVGAIVQRLVADGAELSEPDRVKVPTGWPADHPNADLLRRDGFHVARTVPHPAEIATPAFSDWCVAEFGRFRPLLDWFAAV